MTRNEWIAETAREYNIQGTMDSQGNRAGFDDFDTSLWQAERDASILEKQGYAPWQPPAPALTDTAAKVVEAAELWLSFYGDGDYDGNDGRKARLDLKFAVRAHLAAKQGGAS